MSKIGKKPIELGEGVKATVADAAVVVVGPKGELRVGLPPLVKAVQENGQLLVEPIDSTKAGAAFWGLARSLLANAVQGVSGGFQKELELVGVGYRVQKKDPGIELEVGFSHKVDFTPPEGVSIEIEKGVIRIMGIDKQKVGQVAAEIRAVRPPEPYKGKGIRYVGEHVQLKPGKTAKAGGA